MRFRALAVVFVVALVASACGGGSETTESTQGPTGGQNESSTTQQTDANSSTTSAPDNSGGGDSTDVGSASVTVDGTTYRFADSGQPFEVCAARFGMLQVVLMSVDADGVAIQGAGGISLVAPLDNSGGSSTVEFASPDGEVDFYANPDSPFPDGSVDSVTADGNSVEGSATFIAVQDADQSTTTVTGTFEASCPDS